MSDDRIVSVRILVQTKDASVIEHDNYGDVDTRLGFRASVEALATVTENDLAERGLLRGADDATRLAALRGYVEAAIGEGMGVIDAHIVRAMVDGTLLWDDGGFAGFKR